MKTKSLLLALAIGSIITSCNDVATTSSNSNNTTATQPAGAGQSAVVDETSSPDIVKVAASSDAHTTLVTAVKAAELVDALSNAGPFTVFAPTNEAFDKLPKGTVEDLLKKENQSKLKDILEYHVVVGVIKEDIMSDGQTLGMVNGGNVTVSKKDGKITLNGNANIVGSVPASNGVIYVLDNVLLPPAK